MLVWNEKLCFNFLIFKFESIAFKISAMIAATQYPCVQRRLQTKLFYTSIRWWDGKMRWSFACPRQPYENDDRGLSFGWDENVAIKIHTTAKMKTYKNAEKHCQRTSFVTRALKTTCLRLTPKARMTTFSRKTTPLASTVNLVVQRLIRLVHITQSTLKRVVIRINSKWCVDHHRSERDWQREIATFEGKAKGVEGRKRKKGKTQRRVRKK